MQILLWDSDVPTGEDQALNEIKKPFVLLKLELRDRTKKKKRKKKEDGAFKLLPDDVPNMKTVWRKQETSPDWEKIFQYNEDPG